MNELLHVNSELKNFIKPREVRLSLKIKELKNIINKIKRGNIDLKLKTKILESNQKKNILIISWFKPISGKNPFESIRVKSV